MIKISAFLLLIGLAPLELGILVLTVANVIPPEISYAWAAIIVGGTYTFVSIIHIKTRILEKILQIQCIPFWFCIVALLLYARICAVSIVANS